MMWGILIVTLSDKETKSEREKPNDMVSQLSVEMRWERVLMKRISSSYSHYGNHYVNGTSKN